MMLYEDLKTELVESCNIVCNLLALSSTILDIVSNKFSKTSLEDVIISRYESTTKEKALSHYGEFIVSDIMKTIRHMWVVLACTKIYSRKFIVSKKSATALMIRKISSLGNHLRNDEDTALRWYIRGLFLSDGAVRRDEKAILFHSSRPEIPAIALCLADRATVTLTMYRRYKITGIARPYLEIKIPDIYGVREWFYNKIPEMPENKNQLAALIAGLLDGDGSVDATQSKVRISARPNPSSNISRRKVSIVIKILSEFSLARRDFMYTRTFQTYDYITLPLSDYNVREILKESLNYMLVKHKRTALAKILSKHITIAEQASMIKRLLNNSNILRIRCRTKRYGNRLYKCPYIRGPLHTVKELSKKLLEVGIRFYGPYKVDKYRGEITLPQSFSDYLCEE